MLLFALSFAALYMFFIRTVPGQQIDAWSLGALAWAGEGPVAWLLEAARRAIPIVMVAGACLLAGWWGLVRRRARRLVAAVVVALVSAVGAQLLKAVLVRPDLGAHGYVENTFPSGHVAVVLGAGIAVSWLWPWRRTLPLAIVVVGGLSILAMIVAIGSFAHRPSDVLGAAMLVGAVATCSLGGPTRGVPAWAWLPVGGGFVGGLGLLALAWWLTDLPAGPQVAAAGFGLACLSAVVGVVLAVDLPGYTEPTTGGSGTHYVGDSA